MLNKLTFDHSFTDKLPSDPMLENSRRQVFEACYSWVKPTSTKQPQRLIHSQDMANQLDLGVSDCESELFTKLCSGNALLKSMKPYAMCYGGHQFGNWAGQLGDGRAINLGEVVNNKGDHWMLQLKGAGATPYSRTADGLAVLRSSVREFLCSEAMFHLGVPTTRALSLCKTGDSVWRDMFYDGHPAHEQGAVVCRAAPSFLRFGNFEIFSSRNDTQTLKKLLDYTITSHFPHLVSGDIDEHTYLLWFAEVCDLTQDMIVHWQRVGFVHGVMNTDNMSILGLTIDYGPYGWLEDYNPDWTPNTTDSQFHRYAFGNQAQISHWNLMQLAQAIAPLFEDIYALQQTLDHYAETYKAAWQQMVSQKLGLSTFNQPLVSDLFENLQMVETDMTIFFRLLSNLQKCFTPRNCLEVISTAFYALPLAQDVEDKWLNWFEGYLHTLQQEVPTDEQRKINMDLSNPKYVLRNYLAQLAIDQAEQDDLSMLFELFEVLKQPYAEQPEKEAKFAQKRPEWARTRAGCSKLSCSS